jgi:hypothetical protein
VRQFFTPVVFDRPAVFAGAASAITVRRHPPRFSEQVAVFAVREFVRVAATEALDILQPRNRLQVIRVAARLDFTEMVEGHAVANRADKSLINNAVSAPIYPDAIHLRADLPVAIGGGQRTLEHPTERRVAAILFGYARQHALNGWAGIHKEMSR